MMEEIVVVAAIPKLKIHNMRWRPGLHPKPRFGSLQNSKYS